MKLSISKFLTFMILATLSISAFADRSPAVEDFVGVETEDYRATPAGEAFSFNFGNHIQAGATSNSFSTSQIISVTAIAGLLILPTLMWFGIRNSKSTTQEEVIASEESESFSTETEDGAVTELQEYREHQSKKAS